MKCPALFNGFGICHRRNSRVFWDLLSWECFLIVAPWGAILDKLKNEILQVLESIASFVPLRLISIRVVSVMTRRLLIPFDAGIAR